MTPVKFRDCACPNTPHAKGDTVTFRERLPFQANVDAVSAIFSGDGDHNINKAWEVYLHQGPVAWNLVDAEGEPVPLTREALDALDFADQWEIADRADDIYQGTVLAPLVRRMKESSESGPITESPPRRTKR
jgi:hypothetical protein